MITKTGLQYGQNPNLTSYTTIERDGVVSSITVPIAYAPGLGFYCRAYCIDSGTTYYSSIEHYINDNYFYIKNEYSGQNTLSITNSGTGSVFTWSKDKENWNVITGQSTITLEEGEKFYVDGQLSGWKVDCTDNYSIGGWEIQISGTFSGSTTLISASSLETTHLTDLTGWNRAFYNCTNLVSPPDLSNVRIIRGNGLSEAFYGTGITSIDLSSLEEVEGTGLYSTFCRSKLNTIRMDNLKTVGTQALDHCFERSKLVHGIDLSKITSVSQQNGFQSLYAYATNLEDATYPATRYNTNTCKNWLEGAGTNVAGTKTVYCPTGVTVSSDNSGVPSGWTRVDY